MAQHQIRWRQGDFVRLGKAISNFNKKISRLENEENKLYLPTQENYQDVKANITTRKELNRYIDSLRRFQKEGAENLTNKTLEPMTEWQYSELKKMSKTAIRRANKELKELEVPNAQGFSRVQMGSIRANELISQINNFKKFDKLKGWEFQHAFYRLKYYGSSDLEMKRAIVFQENYIREMKKYKGFRRYDELERFLKSFGNPLDFYNNIKDHELLVDLTYQSDEYYTEEEFSSFVSDMLGRRNFGTPEIEGKYFNQKEGISNYHQDFRKFLRGE